MDLVDESGASVPLSQLYNHHWIVYDSTGADPATVAAAGNWPPPTGDPAYGPLARAGASFSSGPCNSLKFARGGGAEFRGVQAQLGWNASIPGSGSAGWVMDFGRVAWGLELHVIDLRHVDAAGAWEGNWYDAGSYPGFPAGVPGGGPALPPNAPGSASQMTGVSQCIQCNCAYYNMNSNMSVGDGGDPNAPLGGGTACCRDGSVCDAFGYYTAQDGGPTWPLARRRQAALLLYNGSSSSNLTDADTQGMAFPPGVPWEIRYALRYSLTFANSSAAVSSATPLISAVLSVDSAAAATSNGFGCATEYTPSTCGACATAACGPVSDYYAAYLSEKIPGAIGYEEGINSLQAGLWGRDRYYERYIAPILGIPQLTGLSVCAAGLPEPALAELGFTVSQLSFSWVVPADILLHTAYGHQHVGGTGIRLYAQGAGFTAAFGARELICDSKPSYGGASDASPGFVLSMSVCDWRAAPLAVAAGTVLTLTSDYWADGAAFPLNASAPSPMQMPWTGAMGYLLIQYALAAPLPEGAPFPWLTANGMQPPAAAASVATTCAPPVVSSGSGVPGYAPSQHSLLFSVSPLVYMNWTFSGGAVSITLVAATSHWFALGIHDAGSPAAGMASADIVVVQMAGMAVDIAEYWATGNAIPTRKSGTAYGNGLSACAYVAGSGWQLATFTRPLAAADAEGATVAAGASATVIFALGSGAALSSGHTGMPHNQTTVTW